MKDRPNPSRSGVLHAVIDEILTRDDGQVPTDIEGITTYFSTIDDLANAVLLRWHTRLVASLERGLVDDPEDREEAVIEAWRTPHRSTQACAKSSTNSQTTHRQWSFTRP